MDLENDERIQALTKAAADVHRSYPFRIVPPNIHHRFERWGSTTSSLLLEQLEKNGWTVTKKEDDG